MRITAKNTVFLFWAAASSACSLEPRSSLDAGLDSSGGLPECYWEPGPPAACVCDGTAAHPTACGCTLNAEWDCVCPDDPALYPTGMCLDDACLYVKESGTCWCDGAEYPPQECGVTCEPVMLTGGGEELFQCQCAGLAADPAFCGCLPVDGVCECAGEYYDAITCHECGWDPDDLNDCFCGEYLAPPVFCGG